MCAKRRFGSTAYALWAVADLRRYRTTPVQLSIEGTPYEIVDFQHVSPGKGRAFTRTKLTELAVTTFEQWAVKESFKLAQEVAYDNGQLEGKAGLRQAPQSPFRCGKSGRWTPA